MKTRILIVDDDEDFLFQHRVQLENAGFEVTTAGSPTCEPPVDTHCSSAATSRAVCHRSSGSFAMQRDTIRLSAVGVSGTNSAIGRGVVASTAAITLDDVLPSKARCPVSNS